MLRDYCVLGKINTGSSMSIQFIYFVSDIDLSEENHSRASCAQFEVECSSSHCEWCLFVVVKPGDFVDAVDTSIPDWI